MPELPYDQKQSYLFPPHLSDWVPEKHPARVFSELVDRLDIRGFVEVAGEGRPRYSVRMMLKVLLWAYANGVRASRKIEARLETDVVFMWLAGRQVPDFHTICDFRKANGESLKALFAQVLVLAGALGLLRLGRVALDGTKVRASAGVGSFKTVKDWRAALAEAQTKVSEILAEAAKQDEADDRRLGANRRGDELPAALASARKRVERIERVLAELPSDAQESLRVSSTDGDARFMHSQRGSMPAYNAQVAVTEDQLIVYAEVTGEPMDTGQLGPALSGIKEAAGKRPGQLLADAGYKSGPNLRLLEDRKVDGYLPDTEERNIGKDLRAHPELYGREVFRYDAEQDCYICPAGQTLRPKTKVKRKTKYAQSEAVVYKAGRGVCQACPQRAQCTRVEGEAGRTISRDEYEPERQRMRQKLATTEGRAIYARRKCLVEPTIGQLKVVGRLVQFLLRGSAGVRIEWSWASIAHNLLKLTRLTQAEPVPAT